LILRAQTPTLSPTLLLNLGFASYIFSQIYCDKMINLPFFDLLLASSFFLPVPFLSWSTSQPYWPPDVFRKCPLPTTATLYRAPHDCICVLRHRGQRYPYTSPREVVTPGKLSRGGGKGSYQGPCSTEVVTPKLPEGPCPTEVFSPKLSEGPCPTELVTPKLSEGPV